MLGGIGKKGVREREREREREAREKTKKTVRLMDLEYDEDDWEQIDEELVQRKDLAPQAHVQESIEEGKSTLPKTDDDESSNKEHDDKAATEKSIQKDHDLCNSVLDGLLGTDGGTRPPIVRETSTSVTDRESTEKAGEKINDKDGTETFWKSKTSFWTKMYNEASEKKDVNIHTAAKTEFRFLQGDTGGAKESTDGSNTSFCSAHLPTHLPTVEETKRIRTPWTKRRNFSHFSATGRKRKRVNDGTSERGMTAEFQRKKRHALRRRS